MANKKRETVPRANTTFLVFFMMWVYWIFSFRTWDNPNRAYPYPWPLFILILRDAGPSATESGRGVYSVLPIADLCGMSANFEKAIAVFDAYHKTDPRLEAEDGKPIQKELLYAQRMTARLLSFAPDADEAVRLAARSQHIGRWEIPREDYSMDRRGYLQWRNAEKSHHAAIADKILTECGYDAATIGKVKSLILKKELFNNPDSQLLEDVVCLVFLEFYLEEFAAKHTDEKVADILRKTLRKMSSAAKEAVGKIRLSPRVAALVERAGS